MGRAIWIPSSYVFTRKFEELPLVAATVGNERFYAGLLSGEYTVEYDADGNWHFGGLTLDLDNQRWGKDAKGHAVALDPDEDEALILMIYNALERNYSSYIEEWVFEELAEQAAA
jgi:hypothetical protein